MNSLESEQSAGMKQFEGRVVVITGGSKGIGRKTAIRFSHAGAKVAILARGRESLDAVAGELRGPYLALECNVADQASIGAAFAEIDRAFGRVDVLINNAAMTGPQLIAEVDPVELRREFDVNFFGPVYVTHAAIPLMRRHGDGGVVINISSDSVANPFLFLGFYAAGKAALETVSKAIRSELREDNIRVMVLRCGYVRGSSLSLGWSEEVKKRYGTWMQTSGHMANLGTPIDPDTVAKTLFDMAAQPAEASVDFIELRPR
jgi:NAD(P)-dependent dehydrogenase (short-subunit alcohol dehydrogenase family)